MLGPNFIDHLSITCSYFGGPLYLLMSMGQLAMVQKRIINWAFAGNFFCAAMLQFSNINMGPDLRPVIVDLSLLDMPFIFLLSPLLYIITAETIGSRRTPLWPHFIAPIIGILISLPYFFGDHPRKATRVLDWMASTTPADLFYIDFVYGAALLLLGGYFIYFMRAMPFWSINLMRNEQSIQHVIFLLSFAALTMLMVILGVLFTQHDFFRLAAIAQVLGACSYYVLSYRSPHLFTNFLIVAKQPKYKKSHLQNVNLPKLEKNLQRMIKDDQIYQDPDLSLVSLAQHLDLRPNQLSQYLNDSLNKSFYQYITQHRVDFAQKMLMDHPTEPIINIAYKAGFNSVSAFNSGFKRFTGMSPSEYRRRP